VSARQAIDLRPRLEGLDRLIARSEGIDPAALTFAFRPLWQMDAASHAVASPSTLATSKRPSIWPWPGGSGRWVSVAHVDRSPGIWQLLKRVRR